jgi:TRAP-type C4-dicarboxylate transport system permease large subunit
VGFNLFVIQGLSGHSIRTIAIAAIPFVMLLAVAVVIITIFPEIALWLPRTRYS